MASFNRVRGLSREVLVEAIVAVLILLAGGSWAGLQGAGYWLPVILVGLGAFGLLGIAQFKAVFEFPHSDDEWMALLVRWSAINRPWQVLEATKDEGGFRIRLRAETVGIGLRRHHSSMLGIETSLVLGDVHKAQLAAGTRANRQLLFHELAIALAQHGVDIVVEAEDYDLQRVVMATALPMDRDLTEFRFAETVGLVTRGNLLVNHIVARAADRAAEASASNAPDFVI